MKKITYSIFKTSWGYFGLAASETGIIRSSLPMKCREEAHSILCANLAAICDDRAFQSLAASINRYFDGKSADFDDFKVDLGSMGAFYTAVLKACRKISAGNTITYAQLATLAGNSKAPRATAGALAGNPIPLIIPCHRIVRTDGGLGGFSAPGGIEVKQKLLTHEQIWKKP